MKSGQNYFTVLATDISGSAIDWLTSGWSIEGEVNGTVINAMTISGAAGADGYYTATVSVPIGQGYISIRNSTAGIFISPDFYYIDTTAYTADDVYGRFLASTGIRVSNSLLNYSFTTVANDDFYESIVVDAPASAYGGDGATITGWNFIFMSDSPSISGSATIADPIQRLINLSIPKEQLPETLIGDATSATINFQVQGTSPTGKVKTVATVGMKVLEDFTNG